MQVMYSPPTKIPGYLAEGVGSDGLCTHRVYRIGTRHAVGTAMALDKLIELLALLLFLPPKYLPWESALLGVPGSMRDNQCRR